MKNQIIALTLLTCSLNTLAQITDLQWLIADGKGKQGTSGEFNIYPTSNTIGFEFILSGVTMPNIDNHSEAYNDLFIIYDDGSHFNSRYNDPTDPFYVITGVFSTVVDHSFRTSHSSGIQYLYLTNGYEQDDLPRKLMVNNGTSPTLTPSSFSPITTPALSASHDAVLTKDITIVVNMDSVRYYLPGTGSYKLFFDGVETVSSPVVTTLGLDIYDPSPVFNGETVAEYPVGSMTISGEYAEVPDGPEKYRYLNLRANDNALIYPPDQNGNPQYNALFRITNGSKTLQLTEPIRHSHDPNFLRVDSICREDDGSSHIYYHLEFENENDVATSTLYTNFKLPAHFDPSCIEATKWMTAGTECEGELNVVGDSCTFIFPASNCAGIIYSKATPALSIGYVEFRVKVKPSFGDVTNVNNSIRLNEPVVYMDGVETSITDFRDLINAKANPYRPLLPDVCEYCGPILPSWAWVIMALGLGGGIVWWRGRT